MVGMDMEIENNQWMDDENEQFGEEEGKDDF